MEKLKDEHRARDAEREREREIVVAWTVIIKLIVSDWNAFAVFTLM